MIGILNSILRSTGRQSKDFKRWLTVRKKKLLSKDWNINFH